MKQKIIMLMTFLLIGAGSLMAQTQVQGTVVDEQGEPVIGASIVLKTDRTKGTISDIDGKFTLSVPNGSTLVFSFVGFKKQEVMAQPNMKVTLMSDSETLDEVIVVAYGTAKKSSFTGSAAAVSAEKISKMQVSDASKALEGQVAGVTVSSESGSPGAGTKIRIRGIGSIYASSAPLIIVDGSPYDGALNTINPADIDAYTVLKDAASAALYGARGANGVVLITTKSGKTGKTVVALDTKVGYNYRGVPEYDIIRDPGTYYETMWRGLYHRHIYVNKKTPEAASQLASAGLFGQLGYNIYNVPNHEIVLPDGKLNPAAALKYKDADWNDWAGALYKPQIRQEYNLSVSKGGEKSRTYFSAGYLDDKGYNQNTYFKRITTRLRYDAEIYSWLKFDNNVQFTNSKRNSTRETGAYANTFSWTRNMPPIYPIYKRDINGDIMHDPITGEKIYDDGTQNRTADGKLINDGRAYAGNMNLVASQREDVRDRHTSILNNNTNITILLPYDFELASGLTIAKGWHEYTTFQTPLIGDAKTFRGRSSKERETTGSINFNQILRWKKTFADELEVSAMLGHESYSYDYTYLLATKTGFLDPGNTDLINGAKMEDMNSYSRKYALEGWFSQLTASYLNRYYLSLSARRDASSVFHPDHRWGSFWSVGGSWRLSEESFMKGAKSVFSDMKIKASYGLQGNDYLFLPNSTTERNYKPYMNQYATTSDGTDISLAPKYMGNENVTWEKNKNLNVGLEFTTVNNYLTGEIEFFQRTTSDMLFNMPVPQSTGFTSQPVNLGDMKNTGIEVTLNGRIIHTEKVRWSLSANLTHYKNEITRLPKEFREKGIIRTHQRLMEGGSIYDYYLVKWGGIDPETGSALYMLKDKEDDTEYKAQAYNSSRAVFSKQTVGTSLPKIQGGFGTTLEAYGFDLSLQFSYAAGGKIIDYQYRNLMDASSGENNWHVDILGSWTPENKGSMLPRLEYNNQNLHQTSDRFLTDASYLALRNVSLGYTLPKSLLKTMQMQDARIFLVSDNVALWSKRKGFDPRMSIGGDISVATYSPIRTVSLGINVKF